MKINSKQSGFTIIEVLIVLAIAGLIMMVVFLAVPALQRNSRTTQLKAGGSAILATANEYVTNNNGAMPTGCAIAAGTGAITISGAAGTNAATGRTQGGYTCATGAGLPAANAPTGAYTLILNQKCNGNTALTAANRAFAVGFTVETATGTIPQCIDS